MPLLLSAEHEHVFQKEEEKKKDLVACKTLAYSLLPCVILVGV